MKNTVFVYQKRRVIERFVNLGSDEPSLQRLAEALTRTLAAR